MILLDCTLRDGGYYNSWDFDEDIVKHYLSAISMSGISYVELGLRNFPKQGVFLGPFAYTTEDFLNSLDLPEGCKYGVMVDAKTVLESELVVEDALEALFAPAEKSKIRLVRVAAHFHELEKCIPIVNGLKEMGYVVGLNMMQAGGQAEDVIEDKARLIQSWNIVDVLYFADSLGNMDGLEVARISEAIKRHWDGPIGIHTHNNMGRAIDNSLVAFEKGVEWLDSTITGMGRGAGNAETEKLLSVLSKYNESIHPEALYSLVLDYFEPLQKKYGWGSNLLYFLGAQHDVHPTYIQNILADTHLSSQEIVVAIEQLFKMSSTKKYDGLVLEDALQLRIQQENIGGDNVSGLYSDRDFLFVANSPSTKKHIRAIERFIDKYNPIVATININDYLGDEYVDLLCISHNLKYLSQRELYSLKNLKLLYPKERFTAEELKDIHGGPHINYGVRVSPGEMDAGSTSATIPFDLTFLYALVFACSSGAQKVYLAGFEGYESGDHRQLEMLEGLEILRNSIKDMPVMESLTPTTYPIEQGSIYSYV